MDKKGKKKMIIWIISAITVIITSIALIFFYPLISMKPAETGEIPDTGIIAVKNNRNAVYFMETEDGFIAVDTGSDRDAIEKTLAELSIDPLKVTHIFLTHVDSDHVASLNLFPNAEVYIGEDEIKMLDGSTKRNANSYCSLPDGFDKGRLITLSDNRELSIGDFSIRCLKSPGHTIGSMSFLVNQSYLFTGDALRIDKGKISVSPFSMDKAESQITINRLYEQMKECKIVLTSHYGYHDTKGLQNPSF